ncbi:CHAT domain-containing protein [Myxococcota bacterium]|nr:CHAT domain-containing protein [Myxococcota bacterium]
MEDPTTLLDHLDQADDETRERIWSAASARIMKDDVDAARRSRRPCTGWLLRRLEAGPPGQALPDALEARARLLGGEGTRADAYAALFTGPQIEDQAQATSLLLAATAAASTGGMGWLCGWLAARAVLASIAAGDPQRAWGIFDHLTRDGHLHPALEGVSVYQAIRGHGDLETSALVRATAWLLWPRLKVPAVPELPFPTMSAELIDTVLARLQEVGAEPVRGLALTFLDAMATAHWDEYADHPLVLEIERRALCGDGPPQVQELPSWFADWARHQGRLERTAVAYVAGHLLHEHGWSDKGLVAMLFWPRARPIDLEILVRGFPEGELHASLVELQDVAARLAPELAQALVAVALPRHTEASHGMGALLADLSPLDGVSAKEGGLLAAAVDMLRAVARDREKEHAEAAPAFATLRDQVDRAVGRLGDCRQVTTADIEREAATIRVPSLTMSLLELFTDTAVLPLSRLVLALVLLRAVEGTAHAFWSPALRKDAVDAIGNLGMPRLLDLRLRLLDGLIADPGHEASLAELYLLRANTRWALLVHASGDPTSLAADLVAAFEHAGRASDLPRLVEVVALMVRTAAEIGDASGGPSDVEVLPRLDQVLALSLPADQRARLLQAKARVLRRSDPAQELRFLAEAMQCLPVDEPYRWEITAEHVIALVRARRAHDAVAEGRSLVAVLTERASDTVISMGHHALGFALEAVHDLDGAKLEYGRALDRVRGQDWRNEAASRLRLAQIALVYGDQALWDEHSQVLTERQSHMAPAMAHHFAHMVSAAAHQGLTPRAVAMDAISSAGARNATRAAVAALRLQEARLALSQGQAAPLDRILRESLAEVDDHDGWDLLLDLACDYSEQLDAPLLQELAQAARSQQRRVAEARLLAHLGATTEACDILDAALVGDLPLHDRLGATHLLVRLLGPDRKEDRLARCMELEQILDQVDSPRARIDLASCFRILADGDPSLLERAWTHATRAVPGLKDPEARAHGHAVIGRIITDQVDARTGSARPELVERARWLLIDHPMPPSDLAELRVVVAYRLLIPGPLTLPAAMSLASELLALVARGAHAPDTLPLAQARLNWIRDLTSAEPQGLTRPPDGIEGPWDATPAWLVRLVAGHPVHLEPSWLEEGFLSLMEVVHIRRDRADHVLACLVQAQEVLNEQAQEALFELVHGEVSGAVIGEGAWTELDAAVSAIPEGERPGMAAAILDEIQRARSGVPRAPRPLTTPTANSPTYAREAWSRAVKLMHLVHDAPFRAGAKHQIQEARDLLGQAVEIARREAMSELPDFLISLGNAWKMPPDEDVERALGIYDEVAQHELHKSQLAKLQKVHGDALCQRGGPDDLRRALELLQRSARGRTGWLRAESLLASARVALQHPDWPEADRLSRASELLLEAVRADANHVEGALDFLLKTLGDREALRPNDPRPNAIREELKRRYPEREADIQAPNRPPAESLVAHVLLVMTNPACRAYVDVSSRLMPAGQRARAELGQRLRPDDEATRQLDQTMEGLSMLGKPDEMERVLADLDQAPHDDDAAPGVALARLRILAELCRRRLRPVSEVREASRLAREAHDKVAEDQVRAFLLREHARIWSPLDHADDPVRDFALSVELATAAMALEGGEALASTDTVELVARGLRYSPSGDIEANTEEARRLYAQLAQRARKEGNRELAANSLLCLADALSHGGDGDRMSRLRAAEAHIEEAVKLASTPYRVAEYNAYLAWQRTLIAHEVSGEAHVAALRAALATFDAVDQAFLDEEHEHRNFRLNRCVCLGALERATKGRQAEAAVWRAELVLAEQGRHPHLIATMQHNLANALIIGRDVTSSELREGLALCEKAVQVRTPEANVRHHWETCFIAGSALVTALGAQAGGRSDELPWPPALTWDKAIRWLRLATETARSLGPGEELAKTALELVRGSLWARALRDTIAVAEEGWAAMGAAMPFLMLHHPSAAREAYAALQVANVLARSLAEQGPQVAQPGLAFAMDGDRAHLVLRWVLRGFAPLRRPLVARLQRPDSVGLDRWPAWLDVLARRDPVALTVALRDIKASAPDFLSADPELGATWTWLRAHPGAVAVAVVLVPFVSLTVLLWYDDRQRQRVQVLGIPLPPPPVRDDVLWQALSQAPDNDDSAMAAHQAVAAWAREGVAAPVLRFLHARPSAILWCPSYTLRQVAPQEIWGRVPVATTSALALADLSQAPPRGRSTLVVLADPAAGPLDLRSAGVPAARRLVEVAAPRGETRALVSVGDQHGTAVGLPHALTGPASPSSLLRRARDHDVFVIIAHGEAPAPDAAALVLLDERGEPQRLDVQGLAAHPGAFTGATVILLACESGRVGSAFHEPGGVAGALVAAGARAVVAPLWPIRLDVAEEVAVAVLRGLADGREPFEVLAALESDSAGAAPLMGPAPAVEVQRQRARRHRQAFITWVG